MFLGLGAVSSLTGCDTDEAPFYAFTKLSTCQKQLPGQCEAAYKLAEREAKRKAYKDSSKTVMIDVLSLSDEQVVTFDELMKEANAAAMALFE